MKNVALVAVALNVTHLLAQAVPDFDWKQLAWSVASALLAAGLEWLRRFLSPPSAPPAGVDPRNPPT